MSTIAREGARDLQQPIVVDREHLVLRLPVGDVGLGERGPEAGVVAERLERLHEAGVEPAARAPGGDRISGIDAALGVEDLHGLRQAQDPAEQRDLVAGEPERLSLPVPVLVERADRLGRAVRQADHERDLGPAVAPCPHQRARHLALVLDGEQAVQPGTRRAPGRNRLH